MEQDLSSILTNPVLRIKLIQIFLKKICPRKKAESTINNLFLVFPLNNLILWCVKIYPRLHIKITPLSHSDYIRFMELYTLQIIPQLKVSLKTSLLTIKTCFHCCCFGNLHPDKGLPNASPGFRIQFDLLFHFLFTEFVMTF